MSQDSFPALPGTHTLGQELSTVTGGFVGRHLS